MLPGNCTIGLSCVVCTIIVLVPTALLATKFSYCVHTISRDLLSNQSILYTNGQQKGSTLKNTSYVLIISHMYTKWTQINFKDIQDL